MAASGTTDSRAIRATTPSPAADVATSFEAATATTACTEGAAATT
jgi:hypothetical protein